jgi:hypothetical protein
MLVDQVGARWMFNTIALCATRGRAAQPRDTAPARTRIEDSRVAIMATAGTVGASDRQQYSGVPRRSIVNCLL